MDPQPHKVLWTCTNTQSSIGGPTEVVYCAWMLLKFHCVASASRLHSLAQLACLSFLEQVKRRSAQCKWHLNLLFKVKHSGTRCIYHVLDSLSLPYHFFVFQPPYCPRYVPDEIKVEGLPLYHTCFLMSPNVQRKEHGEQKCFAFLYSKAQGCILSVFILLFTILFHFSLSSVSLVDLLHDLFRHSSLSCGIFSAASRQWILLHTGSCGCNPAY